jgi:hypothetical protein
MSLSAPNPIPRIVEYDSLRRRLWILGQRCHHGAGGSLVAALACAGLMTGPLAREQAQQAKRPSLLALAATGGALMVHDWKDRSIWFQRGYGSQP